MQSEGLVGLLGIAMIGVMLFSLVYPWRESQWGSRRLLHLPLLLIPLFVAYEVFMPENMNIRADLFYLLPAMLVTLLVYLGKATKLAKGRGE